MNLLLDTHAFLWWTAGDPALSIRARKAIEARDNKVYVSAVSAWEITTKFRIDKLPGAAPIVDNLADELLKDGFTSLSVSFAHGQVSGALPGFHKDPFDRLLIAQAMVDGMALVSNERIFDAYGVHRIW